MNKPCPGRPARGVRRQLAVLAFSLTLPLPATAGSLNLTGVVPGGSMMRKEVVSVREARFTDLVRQSLDYS
nr:hypothetical protein [Pseudomonadota bacterium]